MQNVNQWKTTGTSFINTRIVLLRYIYIYMLWGPRSLAPRLTQLFIFLELIKLV